MKKNYFTSGLPKIITKTVYLLLVMSFLISISSYSQITKTFTSSGTLEVPAGVTTLSVQTWGAGGGGPAALLGILNILNVAGGGGGAFKKGTLNNIGVDPNNVSISYTVGAGGTGGVSSSVDGKDGGTTTFSSVSANGGKGGAAGILSLGGILNLTLSASNGIGGKGGDGQIKVTYTCPTYSITEISADNVCVISGTKVVTLKGFLPVGKYTVTYTRCWMEGFATAIMKVAIATPGTGTIDVIGLPMDGLSSITVTKLESVDCSSIVNKSIILGKPVKPIVGALTQYTCTIPTASIVLSGLSALSTWTINATPNTIGLAGLTGTGMTTTVSGLTPGTTYKFTVSQGSCTSDALNVSVGNLPPTRTWNGSWDVVPTIENKVIFASNYDKDESVEACSCEVKSGADVTFQTGKYLKIRNELIVDPASSLTFENNASLVQMSDDPVIVAKNLGEIAYKRYTKPVKRYDYTYWSSPVAGQTLYDLSPNTLGDKYHGFDPNINNWVTYHNGAPTMFMTAGEGYIIRAPQTFSITSAAIDFNPKFIGKPNNGEVTKELESGKLYLLGNPYPSAISADAFLTKNNGKLEGTLYFWTHNSPPSDNVDPFGNQTTKYNYTTNDYASYNKTGGVITAKPAVTDEDSNDLNDNNNLSVPTGKIAAGQGFFAPAKDGGTIVFNNSMRLLDHAVMDNSQFFKLETTAKSTSVIEKSRLWLNLTNKKGVFKQTLVGYLAGATNNYEGNFDGVTYDGNQFVDFYSVNKGSNLSIQGRALPFVKKDSVVLGYRTTIKGEFQISIDHADGMLVSHPVFLEDRLLQVLHNLKEPYSFTTEKGVFNDRFVLRYEDKNAEIIDTVAVSSEGVVVATTDKNIMITTTDAVIKEVYIYNFSGGLVYSDTKLNATVTTISNLLVDGGGLIVQAVLENGKKVVQKIIY